MKKILYILLFLPFTLSAQTFFPVQNIYVKDIFRIGNFYMLKNADSLWIEKPLGVFKNRLDTTRGASGSTVFASDGVRKHGDTIKLGNTTNEDININGRANYHTFGNNNHWGVSTNGLYVEDTSFCQIQSFDNSTGSIATWAYVQAGDSAVKFYSYKAGSYENDISLDNSGMHFNSTYDSTMFIASSFPTIEMMKREIYGNQHWTKTSQGIRYNALNGDSITISNDGILTKYNGGSVTAKIEADGSITSAYLSGTGDRNVGVNSSGKLIDLSIAPGVLQSATVNLNATQIYNNTWVTVVPSPGAGKMIILNNAVLYYKHNTTAYNTTGSFFVSISYDGGSTQIDLNGYGSTVISETFSAIYSGINIIGSMCSPTTGALSIANTTPMTTPTGDGTLTITIYYTIIDI